MKAFVRGLVEGLIASMIASIVLGAALFVAWSHGLIDAGPALCQVTWINEINTGVTREGLTYQKLYIALEDGRRIELGLRSDGALVWREARESAQKETR